MSDNNTYPFNPRGVGNVVDAGRDPRVRSHNTERDLLSSRLANKVSYTVELGALRRKFGHKQGHPERQIPSSFLNDTSQRLADDASQQSEYVKGLGKQVLRTELLTYQRVHARDIPETGEFQILAYSGRVACCDVGLLRWNRSSDDFHVITSHNCQLIRIPAAFIQTVYYSIELRKFLLSNGKDSSLLESEHLFHLERDEAAAHGLRSLFEKRFSGLSVHKVNHKEIQDYEVRTCHTIRHGNKLNRLKHTSGLALPTGSRAKQPLNTEIIKVSKSKSNSIKGAECTTYSNSKILYMSGEALEVNQLVLRMRDPKTIEGDKNMFCGLDLFDGPFAVVEISDRNLPESEVATSSGTYYDSSHKRKLRDNKKDGSVSGKCFSDDSPDETQSSQQPELLSKYYPRLSIKLQLPKGSSAKKWVALERLRPIYRIPDFTDPNLPVEVLFKLAVSSGPANSTDLGNIDNHGGSQDPEYVSRIAHGKFVTCSHVLSQGLEGGYYEINKLRGKRLIRSRKRNFPDEPQDSDLIKAYKDDGGYCGKGEVVVVQYLVHWAGWPSEDDTYERAFNNIPQQLIDDYEASVAKPRDSCSKVTDLSDSG